MDPQNSLNTSGNTDNFENDSDNSLEKKFSFPNADQYIPGATGPLRPAENQTNIGPRKTVNIMDALSESHKRPDGTDGFDTPNIRTYQGDVAGAIKNDNVSMIKIALAEKKRQDEKAGASLLDSSFQPDNTKLYVIIGGLIALLVIGGLVGGFFFLRAQSTKEQVIIEEQKVPQLVYTEVSSNLDIDGKDSNDILRLLQLEKNALMDLGTMKAVILTTGQGTSTRPITTKEFFSALGTRAPYGLTGALSPNFTLGVYAYNPREMFALFKVNTYDAAFAGMLEWEPGIETDIGEIFINRPAKPVEENNTDVTNTDTQGTSTSSESQKVQITPSLSLFNQQTFEDRVIENKDARILPDSNGNQTMLYSFLDKETLVIATSEKSLKEIIFRLTTGRISR